MSAIPFVAKTPDINAPARTTPTTESLRGAIMRRSMPLLVLIWAIMALWAYQDALSQTNTLFDAAMVQSSEVLFSLAHHEMDEIKQVGPHQDEYAKPLTFQVYDDRGHLAFHTRSAPQQRLSNLSNGFSNTEVEGEQWRVYAYHEPDDTITLLIGERESVRHSLALRLMARTMAPLALALPLLAWAIRRSVKSSLTSTEQVVLHLRELAASRLEPVATTLVPLEIRPLVDALNSLFERLRSSYEHERRFTSDAAHELRTPLAALKVNAQVMLNDDLPPDHRHRLERVVTAANRCEALVVQLLTLARLEHNNVQHALKPVLLPELAQGVVSELAGELLDKNIEIHLPQVAPDLACQTVLGDPDMLRILLRNVLDNALRYSPNDGAVTVDIAPRGQHGTCLSITDDGPGIPAELRERAFDRFFRIAGNKASGSGLGLSIVRRIASLHGAVLSLGEGPHGRGLRVELVFSGNEPGSTHS